MEECYLEKYGNGCRTSGMRITMGLLLMVVHGKKEIVSIGFIGVVAGESNPGTAVQRFASDAPISTAPALWAFAS